MYREVHGRRIKWLHDVEEATPADFKAVYDASQLGDVNNGVDRTPQLVEHDQRCRTPAASRQTNANATMPVAAANKHYKSGMRNSHHC